MDIDEVRKMVDIDSFFRSREKLVDGVFNALRYLITTQRIVGGERLDYKELGTLLNVSRVPIREAVQRLEASGLLEVKNNLGTYVVKLSSQEVKQVFELRLMLETQSLKEGFDRIPTWKLQELRAAFDEEAGSVERDPDYQTPETIKASDDDFHVLLVGSANSRVLSRAYTQIEGFILMLRNMNRREYVSSQEHIDIIDAILGKDLDRALQLLERHIRSVLEKTLAE